MITLFTTFFLIPNNEERQRELLVCLNKNVQNSFIKNIFLLLDGKDEDLTRTYIKENVTDVSKINFVNVKRIPTYGDWIQYSKWYAHEIDSVSVFVNADIYLDETIEQIKEYTAEKESFVCLSRHDVVTETELVPHPNPQWSQDLWAISKENISNLTNTFFLDELSITSTGVYRCDNKLAYIFAMRGWRIFNPFPLIKCMHLQKSPARAYGKLDTNIVGGLCFPTPTDSSLKPSVLDISVMPVKVGNIAKCAINKYLEKNLFPEIFNNSSQNSTTPNNITNTEVTPFIPTTKADIVFFGASVTKQKEGYVTYFQKAHPTLSVERVAVGATHLKDAGVCLIYEVIQKSPKYCFLDWFTPSIENYTNEQLQEYLSFIIRQLFDINCIPIMLFLNGDGSGRDFSKKILKFDFIINEICNKYRVPYIKVYEKIYQLGYNDNQILKDDVHTTQVGSELYSVIITENFRQIKEQCKNFEFSYKPEKNKYLNIKKKELPGDIKQKIIIRGNADVIGIFQKIGPFTGWVEIKLDDGLVVERCLVDKHCYYTRECFNFTYTFNRTMEIAISSKPPDYSVCKNPPDYGIKDWDAYYKRHVKKLNLKEVYYIGEITEIIYE